MKHSVTAGRDKRYVATAFFKDPTNLKRCFVSVYNRPAAILQPQPIQDCPPSLPPSGFPVIYTKSNYWYVKPLRCWPTQGRVTRVDAYGPHGPQPAIQPVGEPASGVERI